MSLLPFQTEHASALTDALQSHRVALDASDTGTGKTYVACHIAKTLGLNPIIICPKSVMSNWIKVCGTFGLQVGGIANYESIRTGHWFGQLGKEKCPYYNSTEQQWSGLPDNHMFIFDEVHICKNKKTQNSKVLTSSKATGLYTLMLSATVADKPEYFSVVSYMLDFCKSIDMFDLQLRRYQKSNPDRSPAEILSAYTFTEHGSRMRLSSIMDLSQNIVLPELHDLDHEKQRELQENYEILQFAKQERQQQKKEAGHRLTKILRARQHIELVKVPLMVEMTRDFIDEGKSVVLFVNFKDTLNLLTTQLDIKCQVHGDQSQAERDRNIENFQTNKHRIIILMIQSGGVGVSLHDTDGNYPRVSIISPPWSAQDLVQALGRTYRAGTKSKVIQKIIYCSGCVEEKIQQVLDEKMKVYRNFNGR